MAWQQRQQEDHYIHYRHYLHWADSLYPQYQEIVNYGHIVVERAERERMEARGLVH